MAPLNYYRLLARSPVLLLAAGIDAQRRPECSPAAILQVTAQKHAAAA
jgi:hypothetical protein